MASRRVLAAAFAAMVFGSGVVLVAPDAASADASVAVEATCTGLPIVGTTTATANVNATDDVDPVTIGGVVNNTLNVPIPAVDVPVDVTVKEVKLVVPIPSGVTVNDVTFTPSSFTGQTWSVSGSNLTATFTGSVTISNGGPTPTVPDVKMKTTVAGPARTVEWKAPTSITAKASYFLGDFTASCTPTNPNLVLISTVVKAPNRAPTATDQAVAVGYGKAKAVTLSGTDPDGDALTFATTSTPAHGTLSGTAPNLTYTPSNGYAGPDSFTFTASDGKLSDTGTVSLTVAGPSVPGTPTVVSVEAAEGQATVTWSLPPDDGGSPITGYEVVTYADGVPFASPLEIEFPALPAFGSATVTGLTNGVSHTFKVRAVNAVGRGPDSAASSAVTPQWWQPWSSGPVAVTEIVTWMTGKAPTAQEKAAWLAQLNAGTKLPADLVAALRSGPDATTNVDPTVRLYSAYLTRIPDAGGLNFWLNRRRNGWTLSRISNSFATSSEFVRRYGSMTNREFVGNIYANVLQRPGDPGGIAYWTKKLDARTVSRGQVMINFSESNEYKTKQVGNTHAAVVFIHLRGKTPTTAERDAFVAALTGGTPLRDLVTAQIHLPAFASWAG
jgi:hypothetical protein